MRVVIAACWLNVCMLMHFYICLAVCPPVCASCRRHTALKKSKADSAENLELVKWSIASVPGVGQNIALHKVVHRFCARSRSEHSFA